MLLSETIHFTDIVRRCLEALGNYSLRTILPTLVVCLVGLIIIRSILRVAKRILDKSKLEKAAHSLIKTAIRAVLYVLLALIVAASLGIDVTGVIALASVLTLAVSLAVQNALTNVISGFTLLYTKPFSSGDYVEVAGQSGSVSEIGLTYTKLATPDNKYVFIPNGAVTSAQIVNYTVLGSRRIDIRVSVGYENAIDTVLEALKEAGDLPAILPEKGVFAALESYGDSAMTYVLRVWTATADFWPTQYEINRRIKELFDQRGISMTYPHLNVHLDK